jgi:hypothetical protein
MGVVRFLALNNLRNSSYNFLPFITIKKIIIAKPYKFHGVFNKVSNPLKSKMARY